VPARGIFSQNIVAPRNTGTSPPALARHLRRSGDLTGVVEQPYTEDDRRAEHDAERLGGTLEDPVQAPTWLATIIAARKARNIARPPP